jgi:1-aminocyclopropane-1-carboxylate deaminase
MRSNSAVNDFLPYKPTPIQEIQHELLAKKEVRLLVKREDLNHPFVSGNKWWKLKYNLATAMRGSHGTILTFGGAYSNHIYAVAAAASALGLQSIGVIRGERILPLNPTLDFAQSCGMRLHFISREAYRSKSDSSFVDALRDQFGDFYLIPEGGTNALAIQGCEEFGRQLVDLPFDKLLLAVGTGGTIAGLIAAFEGKKDVIGVPVLKNGGFLADEIDKLVLNHSGRSASNYYLLTEYHQGGYGKVNNRTIDFIQEMNLQCQLPLDPVYTAKLFMAIFSEVEHGMFQRGTTLLAIHSGGLQGGHDLMRNSVLAS